MNATPVRIITTAVIAALGLTQAGVTVADDGLPLGQMCNGQPEAFYQETLFERADCGSGQTVLPPARLESEPRFTSPYEAKRCTQPLLLQDDDERFGCAEAEFWVGFTDGRLGPRNDALQYLERSIYWSERVFFKPSDFKKKLARLYQLKGMLKMAMGMENGRADYLIFSELHSAQDFRRVERLDPGNFGARAFDMTLDMVYAQLLFPESAPGLALDVLHEARTAGDPDVVEPINVGTVLAVAPTTAIYPLESGVPPIALNAQLEAGCLPDIPFCYQNTDNALFARPGLEYQLASMYARLGMRDEYIAQLEVVAEQDRYDEWAWHDLVEAQRANPDRLLAKFASFGDDEYADSFATRNNGCMFCHGRH